MATNWYLSRDVVPHLLAVEYHSFCESKTNLFILFFVANFTSYIINYDFRNASKAVFNCKDVSRGELKTCSFNKMSASSLVWLTTLFYAGCWVCVS